VRGPTFKDLNDEIDTIWDDEQSPWFNLGFIWSRKWNRFLSLLGLH
jgi:hypothetical protein